MREVPGPLGVLDRLAEVHKIEIDSIVKTAEAAMMEWNAASPLRLDVTDRAPGAVLVARRAFIAAGWAVSWDQEALTMGQDIILLDIRDWT